MRYESLEAVAAYADRDFWMQQARRFKFSYHQQLPGIVNVMVDIARRANQEIRRLESPWQIRYPELAAIVVA